jgi:hypothetical protein
MPTSMPDTVGLICRLMLILNPSSVVDLGVGFGKYGVLFREYLDVASGRIPKEHWCTRIDGVEGFTPYRNSLYDFVYDHVWFKDIREFVKDPPMKYDVAYCGDVLEHFEKDEALELVKKLPARHVLIQTPNFQTGLNRTPGWNPLGSHKCRFEVKDFPPGSVLMTLTTFKFPMLIVLLTEDKEMLARARAFVSQYWRSFR